MKFQLKTLAAAALLAVASGHAAAAIPLNTTATGTGLLFYAFDDKTKTSYMQDMGETFKSFLPGTAAVDALSANPLSFNVSGNAAWTSYVSSVGGNLGNTTWGIVAGISSNAAAPLQYGLTTTVRVGQSAEGQTNSAARSGVATPLRNWVLGVNSATGNVNPVNGYFSDLTTAGNVAMSWGGLHTGTGKLVFMADNFLGATAQLTYLNTNSGTYSINTHFANASFDGNNLAISSVVSAVPEPSTYAMMVAGLALVGGIAARRRKSAK